VKIGSGPAAVTLPFSWNEKGTLLAGDCHCLLMNVDGKAAGGVREPEDLP